MKSTIYLYWNKHFLTEAVDCAAQDENKNPIKLSSELLEESSSRVGFIGHFSDGKKRFLRVAKGYTDECTYCDHPNGYMRTNGLYEDYRIGYFDCSYCGSN